MSSYAIRLEELTKDYQVVFWRPRPVRALDGVSLDVEPGEILGFLGPNGAGKTTTLKLLLQLIYPTSGRAEILGRPAGDVEARRRLGYLPELPYFYDNLTAEELLVYFGGLFGLSAADARSRSATLLDRVGLGAARRRQLRKYSKGMLQRVGIAQALVNDPEVVFLDEPMSGLDPVGRRDTRDLIRELRDEGRTVFFSSHILSDAEALCSRVAILVQGRLVASGRLADLAFEILGWELIVTGTDEGALSALGLDVVTTVGDGRFVIDLPVDRPPDQLLPELGRRGLRVVSLTPRHESLEEYFMRLVEHPQQTAS
ncbi:MAG TPA: ABC transporter ATP-binding protein [Acidobacteria bacterium]|nr:ABC transporter ATP-binding protein [Acidobacteriota bacterium]